MTPEWPIRIVVLGKAEPAGSKTSFIPKSNDLVYRLVAAQTVEAVKEALGGLRANVVDANPNASGWKEAVAWRGVEQYKGPILETALDVEFLIVKTRPKYHFGTGKNANVLKDNAPLYPTMAPDTTKFIRGIEDALTGIVWKDDAQIVNQVAQKRYGEQPRVEIRVRETALTTVRDLLILGEERPARPSEVLPFEQLTLALA